MPSANQPISLFLSPCSKIIVALIFVLFASVEQQAEGSDFTRSTTSKCQKSNAPPTYTSLEELMLAAKTGNPTAQVVLGWLYYKGEDVPQDFKEAVKWFRLAAEQGYRGGQCQLAICYLRGDGVSKDHSEAAKWFRLAAEQDSPFAQSLLGYLYLAGVGVIQDEEEGYRWILKAAEGGDDIAQCVLGSAYESGPVVDQDFIQAYMWYDLSAEQGNDRAIKARAKLSSRMTPEQISEAKKLSTEFVPRRQRRTGSNLGGSIQHE